MSYRARAMIYSPGHYLKHVVGYFYACKYIGNYSCSFVFKEVMFRGLGAEHRRGGSCSTAFQAIPQ